MYEKTAAFLGYEKWADLLATIEGDKKAYFKWIMHFSSHTSLSNEEIAEPTETKKQTVKCLLDKLNNYGAWSKKKEQQND